MKKIHYGWVILLLCFIALLTVQGIRLSFGAFIQPWETEFSTTRGNISLIATLSFIVYGISQPIMGRLIDTFGVRTIISYSVLLVGISTSLTFFVISFWQIIFLYGIISSIGFGGASNVAASVAVTNWFHRKKGLALGMMTAGMSAGQLLVVPLCLFLIVAFDWKVAVLILGSFLIIIVFPLLIFFLRTTPSEIGEQPYGELKEETKEQTKEEINKETNKDTNKETNKEILNVPEQGIVLDMDEVQTKKSLPILKTRYFWFLALPFMICGYTTTGLIDTHLIPFSHDHGFSTNVTGAAVSLLAAFNIIGTLCSGQIADHFDNRKFLAFLYFTRGLTIILLLLTSQWLLLLIFAVLFGLVDFATVAPTTMLAIDFFKKQSVGYVIGLLSLCHQVGSALGAYIPGLLYDLTGGYDIALISAIILLMVAALLNLALPKLKDAKLGNQMYTP
jgi:MFS family permease